MDNGYLMINATKNRANSKLKYILIPNDFLFGIFRFSV